MRVYDRPKLVLYRFVGVFITPSRLKFDFVRITSEHLPNFLAVYGAHDEVRQAVAELRELSIADSAKCESQGTPMPCVVFRLTQNPVAVHDSVCLYLNWRMKQYGSERAFLGSKRNSPDHTLINWVVADAFANGRAKITVHERYAAALKQRHAEGIPQCMLSVMNRTQVDADRRLIAFTSQGDLSIYFEDYLDEQQFQADKQATYQNIANKFKVQPAEILLVSANSVECSAATKAGCMVAKMKVSGEKKDQSLLRVYDVSGISFKVRNDPNGQAPPPDHRKAVEGKQSNAPAKSTDQTRANKPKQSKSQTRSSPSKTKGKQSSRTQCTPPAKKSASRSKSMPKQAEPSKSNKKVAKSKSTRRSTSATKSSSNKRPAKEKPKSAKKTPTRSTSKPKSADTQIRDTPSLSDRSIDGKSPK